MALFTSRSWLQDAEPIAETTNFASTPTLAAIAAACVWVQLILGAAFRHSGIKLLPHLIGACVVTAVLCWTVVRVLTRYGKVDHLRKPAQLLLALLMLQLGLGFCAYLTRLVWGHDAVQPMQIMVVSTVAHVAGGALVLAATVVLAIQTRRMISVHATDPAAQARTRKGRDRMSSASQPLAVPREGLASLARDYATLTKARVTTLIVMTAWAGAYFAADKSGVSLLSWTLLHALIGIGLVSGGTAAINEVVERDLDALMRRTSRRPLVTGSMSLLHASVVAYGMTIGGVLYLWLTTNWLTAALATLTSVSYLAGVHADEARASHLHLPGRVSREPCLRCWAGPRFAAASTSKRWCCSPSSSSGSFRTSTPSRGSIAKTTRTRASACCRWWRAMAAPPHSLS